jgi:uncharacterized repeat protein (TIGR03803 family)
MIGSSMLVMFILSLVVAAMPAFAQTPNLILVFNNAGITGPLPYGFIVQGRDGNLYSSTRFAGTHSIGGVFSVTPSGTENVVYNFQASDGDLCHAGVSLGADGDFYGVCYTNGSGGQGIVYKVTARGTFTILHAFTGAGGDGANPQAPPIQAADGNLYGTTVHGGGNNQGTVYKLTPAGSLTILYSFTGGADGVTPGPVMQGSDGYLYGAAYGGANGFGTIYKISTTGKLKVLHAFNNSDGNQPSSALIQGTDGNFYGNTYSGGANNNGVIFKMAASGKLTVLHSLLSATDGSGPQVALVQASDGNFYGINVFGGNAGGIGGNGLGSIYKVTAKGVFSTVYIFDLTTVGGNPAGALVQQTDGLLYGDEFYGPSGGAYGAFYSLNIGAKPFAKLSATAGAEGTAIQVLGQGFSSATAVTFGGTSASFTTESDTFLTATVPASALTGPVVVKIPSGSLTSSLTFKVTPMLKTFNPTSGPVGTAVTITGTGLTQTTTVTFGGVKTTSFTVNSDIQVTATVPAGAKTGTISITTKGGKATSKTKFTVN